MNSLFDEWGSALEPEFPRSFTTEAHRLAIQEDPDDGFGWDVLHPDTCERERVDWGNGMYHVSYACDVSWHIDAVGIYDSHVHAFDDGPPNPYRSVERLLPGIYTLWIDFTLYRDHDNIFGGLEADCDVIVEPQKAIKGGSST